MIFEAIAVVQTANTAIGAVKELLKNGKDITDCAEQLGKYFDAKAEIQKKLDEASGEDKEYYEKELKSFQKFRKYHDTFTVGQDKKGRLHIVSISNKKGSDLKNHTDRESCEYSTTILLDCSEPNTPWEIFVDKKPFALKLGQGVIYKGIEQEHYRNACPMEYSSHVFLHYVDANGPHKDFAFDKRPNTHLVSQGTR
jgi:plasmid maintenance system antidote protein VapI